MNICFLMYPWEEIDPENDTSLALIHECVKRKHGVALCAPANLTIRNSVTSAFCTVINKMEKVPHGLKSFYKQASLREEMLPLAGFDVIIMRANPPLDPLMLNFLDSVKDDVFIMNSLQGLREANNKLYTAAFGDSHVARGFDAARGHFGLDLAVSEGTPVRAFADGYVVFADWTHAGGHTIAVQHADGYLSVYKHNGRLLKRVGERVRARETIALSGDSGEVTTGPHLHFEVWRDGLAQDPAALLVAS